MSNQNTQNTTSNYFDLHSTGVGYLNRVRLVKPERSEPFLAVDISALHGSIDNVEYTRFDCRVSGSAAKDAIMALKDAIEDKDTKILVGFKLGDLYAESFTYKRGEKAGQTGIGLKTRLFKVNWAKVTGVLRMVSIIDHGSTNSTPPGKSIFPAGSASPGFFHRRNTNAQITAEQTLCTGI